MRFDGVDFSQGEGFLLRHRLLLFLTFDGFFSLVAQGYAILACGNQGADYLAASTSDPTALRNCLSTLKGWSSPAEETVRE